MTAQLAPRTIDEAYAVARHTSDMTVGGGLVAGEGRTNHAADVIGAAGMAGAHGRHQLGFALIAIRGEWDRCDKPAKRSEAFIQARALELKSKGRPDVKRARAEAIAWHAREMRERAMKLRGRNVVLGLLTEWAQREGVDEDLLPTALFHWLSPNCPVCTGRKEEKHANSPTLGGTCPHCKGSGTWPRPLGAYAIHAHIADVIGKAKAGMVGRLRG
jgi:hypothetical protein